MPMDNYFEEALGGRIDEMVDACTRCGKCVEVCLATEAAGSRPPGVAFQL